MRTLKYLNFIKNFNLRYFNYTTPFVRVIPTDNCNLNCLYCYQKKINASDMSWDLFSRVFDKAISLKVGFISFLGGEPMLWKYLYNAIESCSKHNVLTDMTTNGTLLNDVSIHRLAAAGLDYLNISVDTQNNYLVSEKNVLFDKNIVKELKLAQKNHGMKLRMNSVIYNNNFGEIKSLLELSKENEIPISLGFIVPNMKEIDNKKIYFSEKDTELLEKIVNYILKKKREKYPVIDPNSYFTNVFRFIKRESFWKCNYPTKYGWINVNPDGTIRGCTKKMDETGFDFLSLTSEKIKFFKKSLETSVKACNPYCYSNCAYDSSFYKDNKAAFIMDNFKKIF